MEGDGLHAFAFGAADVDARRAAGAHRAPVSIRADGGRDDSWIMRFHSPRWSGGDCRSGGGLVRVDLAAPCAALVEGSSKDGGRLLAEDLGWGCRGPS